jgi:hypothetical protein
VPVADVANTCSAGIDIADIKALLKEGTSIDKAAILTMVNHSRYDAVYDGSVDHICPRCFGNLGDVSSQASNHLIHSRHL